MTHFDDRATTCYADPATVDPREYDPDFGRGIHRGEDLSENRGFIVHTS